MAYTIPTTEPESFVAGDTVTWYLDLGSDYDPATWTLTYAFQLEGSSGDQQTTTASDNGDGRFLVAITATESAAFNTGVYHWQNYATSGSERHAIDSGRVEVLPNFAATNTTVDNRSHYKEMLDLLDARLEGRLTSSDVASYSIGGRSMSKIPLAELRDAREYYATKYAEEVNKERRRRGKGQSGKIKTRFI